MALIMAPTSELVGRRPVVLWSAFLFLAFTVAGGVAQSSAQFIIFRVLSGLGACAPSAVGAALIGDMYSPQERGSAMAVYLCLNLAGPVVRAIDIDDTTQSADIFLHSSDR
jgi:MFS family permease